MSLEKHLFQDDHEEQGIMLYSRCFPNHQTKKSVKQDLDAQYMYELQVQKAPYCLDTWQYKLFL